MQDNVLTIYNSNTYIERGETTQNGIHIKIISKFSLVLSFGYPFPSVFFEEQVADPQTTLSVDTSPWCTNSGLFTPVHPLSSLSPQCSIVVPLSTVHLGDPFFATTASVMSFAGAPLVVPRSPVHPQRSPSSPVYPWWSPSPQYILSDPSLQGIHPQWSLSSQCTQVGPRSPCTFSGTYLPVAPSVLILLILPLWPLPLRTLCTYLCCI